MRKLLALGCLLALAMPAGAHFIWLVQEIEKEVHTGTALLVFNDIAAPDNRVPISKVTATKLLARSGVKGERVDVKRTDAKDAFRVAPEGEGVVLVAGVCEYGVVAKEGDKPALVTYYAKTIVRKGQQKERVDWLDEGTPELKLEIVPSKIQGKALKHRVLWQGKPAADIEVTLQPPGFDEALTRKTDAAGLFDLERPKSGGVYMMRAKFVEPKSGEHEGKKYEEVRHFSTFTFTIADWLVAAPPKDAPKKEEPKEK